MIFSNFLRSRLFGKDVFGNQLTGTIPETIARVKGLQILHLKDNRLTGTIPSEFGELPYLSWFDISQNHLHGTIPASFGRSTSIQDFRIVDNYIHGTVPRGACTKTSNVNNGAVKVHGCHGIACPQGWYNSRGHATVDHPCEKCPEGYSNLYMSSTFCEEFTEEDIWAMFFEVMDGHNWPNDDKVNWSNPNIPLCEWGGMICDEKGEVISVAFPLQSSDIQ
jgi:Leucine rich repeat